MASCPTRPPPAGHRDAMLQRVAALACATLAWAVSGLLASALLVADARAQPAIGLPAENTAAVDAPALPGRSATNDGAIPDALAGEEKAALHARYADALGTELGLLEALDALDRDVLDTEREIARVALDRAEAIDALREAEERRARAEQQLEDMREAVRARLRALVRLGRAPSLRFLLSSQDFARSVVKERVLHQLVAGDRQRLERYRDQLTRLQRDTETRNDRLARLEALDGALHLRRARLERQRLDKQALIVQVQSDPVYNERVRRDLDAAHRELTDKVTTLRKWRERKYAFGRLQGKLLKPLNFAQVEVPYGPRKHPRFGTITWHRGVDYRVTRPGKQIVRAVFWGRAAFVGWLTGYGQTLILDHGRGWHTVYAHLDDVLVKEGEIVPSRARIGHVGSTGSLKGRYLYFEIRFNGEPQDPEAWFNR